MLLSNPNLGTGFTSGAIPGGAALPSFSNPAGGGGKGFSLGSILGGLGGGGGFLSAAAPFIGPAMSLIGLLGGHKYDPNNDPNYQAAQRQLGAKQDLAKQYGSLATDAGNQYSSFNPQWNSAVNSEANYLRQDPYTDQYSTSALANATSGADQAYNNANARLSASLAARGITDGSELAGGLAQNASAFGTQLAGAQNTLAQQKIATANNNRNALISLLGGAANTAYGRETGAMAAQGGVQNGLYADYQNLANQDEQRAAGQQAAESGTLQSIGSSVGDALADPSDLENAQTAYYNFLAGLDKNGDPLPQKSPLAPSTGGTGAGATPAAPIGPTASFGTFGTGTPAAGAFGGFGSPTVPLTAFVPTSSTDGAAPPLPAATGYPSAGSAPSTSAGQTPSLISHPYGKAYSLDGRTAITSAQAKSLGIADSGKGSGYDSDGDLITSD